MIIAVAGGDGTGKTVLAQALSRQTSTACVGALKPSVLEASGYHTIFEWNAASGGLADLVERQARRERDVEAGVIDSSVCEWLALAQRWSWSSLSPNRWEQLRELALAAARRYTLLVIMPARVVGGPGPGRFRNAAHNEQLRRLLLALAAEARLPHIVLDDASESERVRLVQAALRGG